MVGEIMYRRPNISQTMIVKKSSEATYSDYHTPMATTAVSSVPDALSNTKQQIGCDISLFRLLVHVIVMFFLLTEWLRSYSEIYPLRDFFSYNTVFDNQKLL